MNAMKKLVLALVLLASGNAFALNTDAIFSSAGAAATNAATNAGTNFVNNAAGLIFNQAQPGVPGAASNQPSAAAPLSANGQANCQIYNQARDQALNTRVKELTAAGTPSQAMQDMGVNEILGTKIDLMGGLSSLLDGAFNVNSLINSGKQIAGSYATGRVNTILSDLGLPSQINSKFTQVAGTATNNALNTAGSQASNLANQASNYVTQTASLMDPTSAVSAINSSQTGGLTVSSASYSSISGGRMYNVTMSNGTTQSWFNASGTSLVRQ